MRLPLFIAAIMILSCTCTEAADFFDNPTNLCQILSQNGLKTGGWKKLPFEPYEYSCSSGYVQTSSSSSALTPANNIAILVTGSHADQAEVFELWSNINDSKTRGIGIKKFVEYASFVVNSLDTKLPDTFFHGLEKLMPTCVTVDWGRAIIEHDRSGGVDTYKMFLVRKGSSGMYLLSPRSEKCA